MPAIIAAGVAISPRVRSLADLGDLALRSLPVIVFFKANKTAMTKLLEQAMDRAQSLPPNMQDEIARVVLTLAGEDEAFYRFTDEERADIAEADAEIARGDIATAEEVKALWTKHIP